MDDIRNYITIIESFNHSSIEEQRPYVPGSPSDPNVQWVKTDQGLKRNPGKSLRWQVVPVGNEWGIAEIPREDKPASSPKMMTAREWRAGTGRGSIGIAYLGPNGELIFPEKETADVALRDYDIEMHRQGYTP